jgi:hypothetical protein
MKIWAWATAIGSVMAIAACGGGSSSSSTTGSGGSGTGGDSTTTTTTGSTTTTTTTTTSGTGGTMGCGFFQYSEIPDCQACGEQNCCSEFAACDAGTDCGALFDCLAGCSDQACQDTCIMDNQAGIPDAQSLIECMTGPQGGTGACNMECSTGVICDSGLQISSNPACGDCLGAQCCDEYTACVNDASTPSCLDCITGAVTMGCENNAALQAAATCRTTKCADDCGGQICDSGLSTSNKACDACLGDKCCDPIKACQNDVNCFEKCLTTDMPDASCATDMLYQAVKTCWNTNCSGANDCGNML